MPARGKFIVLEGIDGSGKRTQLEMVARAFSSRGIAFTQVSFPRYDGFFGKLVARFLNGEFGPLESVDPHFSALLYAEDRRESRPALESDLAAGKALLADRYIASNLAHQGARVSPAKRREFLQRSISFCGFAEFHRTRPESRRTGQHDDRRQSDLRVPARRLANFQARHGYRRREPDPFQLPRLPEHQGFWRSAGVRSGY